MVSELSSRKRTQHRTALSEMKVTTMLFFQEVNTEKRTLLAVLAFHLSVSINKLNSQVAYIANGNMDRA